MKVQLSPAQALIHHGHPREALKYLGDSSSDLFLRAVCHRHLGELGHARVLLEDLIAHPSDSVPLQALWNTYGMVMTDLGEFEKSVECFSHNLRVLESLGSPEICSYDGNDGHKQIWLNLAYGLMRLGRFEEAWPYWERARHGWSWETPLVPWTGEPGRVLVIPEGGIGDQILFSRWIPKAQEFGAKVMYYVHEELMDVLPSFFLDNIEVIPKPKSVNVSTDPYPNINWDNFDFATSVMSLPAVCGMKSISDIPPWKWFNPMGYVVRRGGLCWAAQEIGVQRKTRSIPIEELEPLRDLADWISLAPGRPHPDWIHPFKPSSWADTVQMLCSLDFLVTVDTAVAHLAGALNIETFLVLPLASDWKYFTRELVDDCSPWYRSVTLIRNTDPVSFAPAIQQLVQMRNF